jgi:hypothetical protein
MITTMLQGAFKEFVTGNPICMLIKWYTQSNDHTPFVWFDIGSERVLLCARDAEEVGKGLVEAAQRGIADSKRRKAEKECLGFYGYGCSDGHVVVDTVPVGGLRCRAWVVSERIAREPCGKELIGLYHF